MRRGQGNLPPAPCLPHPAAGAHLPLWDVSLQVSDVMNRKIQPNIEYILFWRMCKIGATKYIWFCKMC